MTARRSTFRLTSRGEFVRDIVRLAVVVLVLVGATLVGLTLFAFGLAAFS